MPHIDAALVVIGADPPSDRTHATADRLPDLTPHVADQQGNRLVPRDSSKPGRDSQRSPPGTHSCPASNTYLVPTLLGMKPFGNASAMACTARHPVQ